MPLLRETGAKFGIARELLGFLWSIRLWWAIPMVALLLFFGILIVVGTTSGVGPFIYALF